MISGWLIVLFLIFIVGTIGMIWSLRNDNEDAFLTYVFITVGATLVLLWLFFVSSFVVFLMDLVNGHENDLDWIEVVGGFLLLSSIFGSKQVVNNR